MTAERKTLDEVLDDYVNARDSLTALTDMYPEAHPQRDAAQRLLDAIKQRLQLKDQP
jgi:hypothetical protein